MCLAAFWAFVGQVMCYLVGLQALLWILKSHRTRNCLSGYNLNLLQDWYNFFLSVEFSLNLECYNCSLLLLHGSVMPAFKFISCKNVWIF